MNYYLIIISTLLLFYHSGFSQEPCSKIVVGIRTDQDAFVIDTFSISQNQKQIETFMLEISKQIYPIDSSRHIKIETVHNTLSYFNERHNTEIFDSVTIAIGASFRPKGANPHNWISLFEFHFPNRLLAKEAFMIINSEPIIPDILPLNQLFLLISKKVYIIDSEAFFDIDECYMGNLEYLIRTLAD